MDSKSKSKINSGRRQIQKLSKELDKLSGDFYKMITKEIKNKMKYGNKEKYEGGSRATPDSTSTLRRRRGKVVDETKEEIKKREKEVTAKMKAEQRKRERAAELETLQKKAELFGFAPSAIRGKSNEELKSIIYPSGQSEQQMQSVGDGSQVQMQLQQQQDPEQQGTQQPMQNRTSEEITALLEGMRSLQEGMEESLSSTSRIEQTQSRMEMTLNSVDSNVKKGFKDMRENFSKLGGLIQSSRCNILIPSSYGHCLLLILSIMFMILKLGYRFYSNINSLLFTLSNLPKTFIPFFYIGDVISLMLKTIILMLNFALLSAIAKSFGIWESILNFISNIVAPLIVTTLKFIKDSFSNFTEMIAQPTLDILDAAVSPNSTAEERKGAFMNIFYSLYDSTLGFIGCLFICFYNSKVTWAMRLNERTCGCSGATSGGTKSKTTYTPRNLTKNQLALVNSSLRSQNLTNKQVEAIKSLLLSGGQNLTQKEMVGLKNAAQQSFVLIENLSQTVQTLINAVKIASPQKAITYKTKTRTRTRKRTPGNKSKSNSKTPGSKSKTKKRTPGSKSKSRSRN